ncbi:MAG: signal peptidase I [Actinomycetia bacterium]|nr:signal peptidase I [Actinomycetes bacterium]
MANPMIAPRPRRSVSAGRSLANDHRDVGLGVLLVVVLVAGVVLGPSLYGTRIGFTVAIGRSMEPAIRGGDLVITRTVSDYEVGDVIVYRVPEGDAGEGHQVIHRITGGSGTEGFVTTGDNRDHPDPWRPGTGDVVGREWFTIPLAGVLLIWLRSPLVLGLLVGVMAFLLVLGSSEKGRGRLHALPLGASQFWMVAAEVQSALRPRERRHRHRSRWGRRGTHYGPRRVMAAGPRPNADHRPGGGQDRAA